MKPGRLAPVTLMLWLGTLPTTVHSAPPAAMISSDTLIRTSTAQPVEIIHTSLEFAVDFGPFTQHLEALLGRYDPSAVRQLVATDPAMADARLAQMEGEEGLMIFMVQNHGALLNLAGAPRRAMRYHVGNPRIALQMTRHDIRAGLYAPLSVLVYEAGPGAVRVEFDQPSTLFGQFGDAEIGAVGRELDGKLARVLGHAARLAAQP
ncbi:hypothetical protein LMG31506_04304 [Cupriavidus yeoncheonensis]|uniref:DUF302 domain-containing protein n=1 Tax=Cupriavidus yeoncheonensis TaxID=1462994 RepID=A0A916J010_9BURK|nr:DUF302 domain-containing protein [Cupriavidus yeoncheonensis]CAG2150837.1 hypothetical protein LMG31506_04304 [Cupriavidus yeoncheonensis]